MIHILNVFEKASKVLTVLGNGSLAIASFIHCVSTYWGGKYPDGYLEAIETPMHYGLILEKLIEHAYAFDINANKPNKKNSKTKPGKDVYCLFYSDNTYAEILADVDLVRLNVQKYYGSLPDKEVSMILITL